MLSTFKTALDSVTQDPNDRKEETLDFVYGSDSIAKDFMPLDGQQRLTTLFLLHYYAALISPDATEKDFATLARFSYATRNCTVAFCKQILFPDFVTFSKYVCKCLIISGCFCCLGRRAKSRVK